MPLLAQCILTVTTPTVLHGTRFLTSNQAEPGKEVKEVASFSKKGL